MFLELMRIRFEGTPSNGYSGAAECADSLRGKRNNPANSSEWELIFAQGEKQVRTRTADCPVLS
jgi:hypothetical protein